MSKKIKIQEAMERLDQIVEWFEVGREVDIEEGLEHIKEGAALVKGVRSRLKELENDFEEVKKELQSLEDEE
jgi:exonuclease VII small subunit